MENYNYSGLCLLAADEPASVVQDLEETCWKNAMEAELQAIRDNNTWSLSDLPKNHRVIGLKWVFKVKRDAAGNIVKHKARLVAKPLRGMHRNRGWIMMRCLHQLQELKQ